MRYNLIVKGNDNVEYKNKILNLFKNGYLTTKDVNDNNIPRFYLTKLIKENKIERVSRGVYIKKMNWLMNLSFYKVKVRMQFIQI